MVGLTWWCGWHGGAYANHDHRPQRGCLLTKLPFGDNLIPNMCQLLYYINYIIIFAGNLYFLGLRKTTNTHMYIYIYITYIYIYLSLSLSLSPPVSPPNRNQPRERARCLETNRRPLRPFIKACAWREKPSTICGWSRISGDSEGLVSNI